MCANYTPVTSEERLRAWFAAGHPAPAVVHYPEETWPGYPAPFVRQSRDATAPGRELAVGLFGLIPHWSKDLTIGRKTYNARTETVAEKPSFRDAWRKGRRCIVPLDAFYEWKTLPNGKKQPYAISRVDGGLMALAGLWESKRLADGTILRTFTIITTAANALLAQLHDRMPVILAAEDVPHWLGETDMPLADVAKLLRPCPPEGLQMIPIDPRMSNVRNQDAAFCQPIVLEEEARV